MANESAGVAIIGGGLIGTSIAWRLAQAKIRVRVLEAGTVGCEASTAGAGMLSPGGEFDKPSPWFDLGIEAMRLYPAFVEELGRESGLPIDFRVCGSVRVFSSREEAAAAQRGIEFQSAHGIRVESVPEGSIHPNSLFYPDDALVNPHDLVSALRRVCEIRGVFIQECEAVREIESNDYDAVVIAAGAWSSQIRVSYRGQPVKLPEVIPIKGHLIGFEPAYWSPNMPIIRGNNTYVLQRTNGLIVAGSTEENVGFDRSVDLAVCADLHRRAKELNPTLELFTPTKRWIGFRPQTAGGSCPYIERVSGTNVWLAYGHYRNGILLAPLTAERIAGQITSYVAVRGEE